MINKKVHTELSLNKQNSLFNFAYVLFLNLFDARVFDFETKNYPVEPYSVNLNHSFTKYAYDYKQSISTNTSFKNVVMHRNDTAMLAVGCEGFQSGYDYSGARYYDSDLSIWLSVDPLASKYPSYSPYAYCYNNPINFIDLWRLEGIEDPNGNTGNAGDGYKQTKDKKYLYGDGLKTKVWDPDHEGAGQTTSNQKGGYVDYKGENISFKNYDYADKYVLNFSNTQTGTGGSNSGGNSPEWLNMTGTGLSHAGYYTLGTRGLISLTQSQTLDRIMMLKHRWGQISPTLKADYKILGKMSGFVKGAGTRISYLGVGISATQFGLESNPAMKFEYGFDTGMSAVGLYPPAIPVSVTYFLTKPLHRINGRYINDARRGMGDLGKAFHAIQLAPFK